MIDEQTLREALGYATQKTVEVVQGLRTTLGISLAVKQSRKLLPKEQVGRFLRLRPEDFKVLEQRYGKDSLLRYVIRMREIAEMEDGTSG